jgi:protein TonB
VVLRVTIDASGNVLNVSIERSSRNRNLDRSAMDAARRWKFNPGMRNGQKVGGDVLVPVDFIPPR